MFPLLIAFTISSATVDNLTITIDASLSGLTNNNYLQGTLRSQDSTRYFGETLGSQGSYLDYISSPDKEFITANFAITNVINASWSGQLKMRYKTDDPLYLGPGTYELKFRRFTGGSTSSAGESNTLLVQLSAPLPSPSENPTPTPEPSSPSPSPSPTPSPSPSPTPTPTPSPKPSPTLDLTLATVATVQGATVTQPTQSGVVEPTQTKSPSVNPSRLRVVLGLGAGALSLSIAVILALRKKLFPAIIKE